MLLYILKTIFSMFFFIFKHVLVYKYVYIPLSNLKKKRRLNKQLQLS